MTAFDKVLDEEEISDEEEVEGEYESEKNGNMVEDELEESVSKQLLTLRFIKNNL